MKTKELIEALQKADPSGELTVNCGGEPIYFVESLPGYYDGPYSELIIDNTKKPFYCIDGYRVRRDKSKVIIHTMSLSDCLYNCNSNEELDKFKLELDDSLHISQKQSEFDKFKSIKSDVIKLIDEINKK